MHLKLYQSMSRKEILQNELSNAFASAAVEKCAVSYHYDFESAGKPCSSETCENGE